MSYEIAYSDIAVGEMDEVYSWLFVRDPYRADAWQSGIRSAISSLSEFPRRCPVAYEDRFTAYEIRQHLHGMYRILFTLIDTDGDGEDDTVRILHVRHGAMDYLGPDSC